MRPRAATTIAFSLTMLAIAGVASGACSGGGSAPGGDSSTDEEKAKRDAAGDALASPDSATPPDCLPAASSAYAVRFDQLGYLPEGAKWAVVLSSGKPAPKFQLTDMGSGALVASGVAGPRVLDTTSRAGGPLTGDRIDLSGLSRPGRYKIVLEDGAAFGPVVVDANAYAAVVPSLVRFFDAQKCGATNAAASQHAACHLYSSVSGARSGDGIAVDDGYTGAVNGTSGTAVDVEGGFHDAGDYIKFLGTTSFTLAVDLLALRDHAAAFSGARAGGVRDALRAEMRWGLDWLVKMLGGAEMYHQVSGAKDHDVGWRIPEADTKTPVPGYDQRPVFRFAAGAGGNLLGRSAAALALGSQVFADDPAYSSKLLALAKTTYQAALTRGTPQNPDPPSFYQEDSVDDDITFGAAVLAQATGTSTYAADALTRARKLTGGGPGGQPLFWGDVTSLALLETGLAQPAGSAERAEMAKALTALAAPILATGAQPSGPGAAFGYALAQFGNGSIEQALGAASVCLAAARLGAKGDCAEIARAQIHWMLGQNPFGVSVRVGAGCRSPANVHHALAQAAHVALPGAIVGGPTSLGTLKAENDPDLPLPSAKTPFAAWSTDALLYEDDAANYVVNEPAIDFTAPLVFALGELLDPP